MKEKDPRAHKSLRPELSEEENAEENPTADQQEMAYWLSFLIK